jgi:hypothetical protein
MWSSTPSDSSNLTISMTGFCLKQTSCACTLFIHRAETRPAGPLASYQRIRRVLLVLNSEILTLKIAIRNLHQGSPVALSIIPPIFIGLFRFKQFQRCWAVFQNTLKISNFLCMPLRSHYHWSTAHYDPMGTQAYPPAFVSCYCYYGIFARSERI